jgi:hypothetical protein
MTNGSDRKIDSKIDTLIETYLSVCSIRPEILFREFLPTGYRFTTIDSVATDTYSSVILAKIHLGMMITLYDDLADHPLHRSPELLLELYKINIERDNPTPGHFSGQIRLIYELARFLFSELRTTLASLMHYETLATALRFDIEQFYVCNRYSELMSTLPSIRNLTESQILGPHNMGIVAAGTIDLMASPDLKIAELGQCREVFLLGQRLGRISNLIYTLQREVAEGDATNEILITASTPKEVQQLNLVREFEKKKELISTYQIQTFQTARYAKGLQKLHQLHASLEGKI